MFLAKSFRVLILSAITAAAASIHAQILLKPAGQYMEPLHQKSIEADAKIIGQFATTKMTHIFANPADQRIEAEFIYTLPVGATVTSFAYWYGDEKVIAYVAEKERARQIYKSITDRQRDPALVELVGKRTFRAKIFPVMPNQNLKVEVTWVSVLPSVKGVPTYALPIAMKTKEDQLESLKAHIEVHKEAWVKSVMNNQGVAMVEDSSMSTLNYEVANVRPIEDLRVALKPFADQVIASTFSGRSAGTDGYFALNAISANKAQIQIPGVKIFALHEKRVGANLVITGKFRGDGTGSVAFGNRKAPITLSSNAIPDHLGVKLWAADELNRLTKVGANAKQIIALSMQHGMPSKYTAWIAIPKEERKLHEQLIKQAQARVMATSIVRNAIRQGGKNTTPQATMDRFQTIAREAGFDPDQQLREVAQEALWSRIEAIGEKLNSNSISAQSRSSVRREVASLKSIGSSMGVNMGEIIATSLGGRVWQNADRLAEQKLSGAPNTAQLTKDHKIVADYCSILGLTQEEVIAPHYYQAVWNETGRLLDNVFDGRMSDSDAEKLKTKIENFSAAHQIDRTGFSGNKHYEVSTILAKDKLNEPIDKNQVAAAKRWLDMATSMKLVKQDDYIRQAVTGWLVNDCYNIGMKYYYESDRTSLNSPEAIAHLDRIAKNIERCDPQMRSGFEQPIRTLCYRAGEVLAQKALRAGDQTSAKNELTKIHALYEEKFGAYKIAGLKDLEMVYDQCIRSGVSSYAWDLHNYKNSLSQTKKGIREREERLERMAKWANLDAKKLSDDVGRYTSEEDKVRYELLQLHIAGSTDTAKIARLEKRLKEFTPAKNATYKDDRVARVKFNGKADAVMDQIDESSDPTIKKQLQAQYEEYISKAKVIAARMGDPLLTAKLPSTCTNVTAAFPWGEVRPMAWNEKFQQFECRFDIPPTAQEGEQEVVIHATGMLGNAITQKSTINVDLTAARFDVEVKDGRIEVKDLSGDIARLKVYINDGPGQDMVRGANSIWWGNMAAKEGDKVRVIATDRAHNRSEYPSLPGVAEPSVPTVELGEARGELEGHNVQSLGHLGDLVFAGTLDEGLWVRSASGSWTQVQGLPSQCPRTMVEFGGKMIVRFGDGNLIEIGSDLGCKSLTGNLPRKQAMGLATDGKTLFVAQPGGYSEFDGTTWTSHFDIEELRGQSVSALAATESKLYVGIQGKGLLVIDRSSGKVESFDERRGLTDDWITQILPLDSGLVVGTFVGGALNQQGESFSLLNGLQGSCVTSMTDGYIGTRTGLYRLEKDQFRRLTAKGLGEEIQALVQVGNTIWIGTRNGVLRINR